MVVGRVGEARRNRRPVSLRISFYVHQIRRIRLQRTSRLYKKLTDELVIKVKSSIAASDASGGPITSYLRATARSRIFPCLSDADLHAIVRGGGELSVAHSCSK